MDVSVPKKEENDKKPAKGGDVPAKNPVKNNDLGEALKTFARLSTWIVFPVLLGVFLGKWLDNKYNSEPRWFLISVGLAFVVSMVGLVSDTLKEYKKIEKDSPPKNTAIQSLSDDDEKGDDDLDKF